METDTRFLLFPYVPAFLPGEVLYAWLGRLHALNARHNAKSSLEDLFESALVTPSVDLPCGLQGFIERTEGWGPFRSVLEVAEKATLYPYFSRFASHDRRAEILSRMARFGSYGPKASMGLLANGFGASILLRRCSACDEENLRKYGCWTWLSVHQLPFVTVCPIHDLPLRGYFVQSQQSNKACLEMRVEREPQELGCGISLKIAARLSKLSMQALLSSAPPLADSERGERYIAAISKLNMTKPKGVDWEKLVQFVGERYQWFSGMRCRNRLLSSEMQPMRWLRDLVQRPDRNQHPICHLLLIGSLFDDVDSFFHMKIEVPVIPNGIQVGVDALHSKQIEALIRDRALSCREVAKRSGMSTTSVVLRRKTLGLPVSIRPKSITDDLLNSIAKFAEAGNTAREISALTGASLSTVYRTLVIRKLSIQGFGCGKKHYRELWEFLTKTNPQAGKTELRAQNAAAYAWLYRNDRDWLNAHSPKKVKKSMSRVPRVNWAERDKFYAGLIREIAAQNKLADGGRRISMTSLLRATYRESMIRVNIAKMPMVRSALYESVEDDEAFCKRRRTHAIRMLNSLGVDDVQEWQIQKMANIRPRRN